MAHCSEKTKRKCFFVDEKVQGALIWRVVMYWFFCLLGITLMLLCWQIVTGPARPFYWHLEDLWFSYGPAAIASLVLLPLVVIDVIRLSNRFVGPLLRLRREMRALASGADAEPLEFRHNDFWRESAAEFNAVAARLKRLTAEAERSRQDEPEDYVTAN
jgi:hypothetical protein